LVTRAINKGLESNKELKAIVPLYDDALMRTHLGQVEAEAAVAAYRAQLLALADQVEIVRNRAPVDQVP
jgi:hypothetical protein